MQSNMSVSGNNITGTLNFIEGGLTESGALSGDGHFMALKFLPVFGNWDDFDSVKVGLQGTELVEILNAADKNGVFKVTSTDQKFIIEITIDSVTSDIEYDLSGLVLTPEPVVTVDPQLYQVVTDTEALSIQEGVYNYQLETGTSDSAEIQYIDAIADCTITSCSIDGATYELTGTAGEQGGLRYRYDGPDDFSINDGGTMTIVTEDANGNSLTYTIRYGSGE